MASLMELISGFVSHHSSSCFAAGKEVLNTSSPPLSDIPLKSDTIVPCIIKARPTLDGSKFRADCPHNVKLTSLPDLLYKHYYEKCIENTRNLSTIFIILLLKCFPVLLVNRTGDSTLFTTARTSIFCWGMFSISSMLHKKCYKWHENILHYIR